MAAAWPELGHHETAVRLGERAVELRRTAGVERYLTAALETTAEALIGLDAGNRREVPARGSSHPDFPRGRPRVPPGGAAPPRSVRVWGRIAGMPTDDAPIAALAEVLCSRCLD